MNGYKSTFVADHDLEKLGIFATRPPYVFPSATTTPTTSPTTTNATTTTTILNSNRAEEESVIAVKPSNPTVALTAGDTISKTNVGASVVSPSTTSAPPPPRTTTTMTPHDVVDFPSLRSAQSSELATSRETANPTSIISSSPAQSVVAGVRDDRRPCRRRRRKGKGRKKGRRGRNDRRGKNGRRQKRRRGHGRRRNKNAGDNDGTQDREQNRNRRKNRRRGCKRRKKNKTRNLERDRTTNLSSVISTDAGTVPGTTGNFSALATTETYRQVGGGTKTPQRDFEIPRTRERIDLSLLEEEEEEEGKKEEDINENDRNWRKYKNDRPLRRYKSRKFFYMNRPLAMVQFKQSQVYRKTKPKFSHGHRVRHGKVT